MAVDWSKWVYTQSATPYLDSFRKLESQYNTQANTDRADINNRRDADLAKSNAQYDNTARQNYVNYMQAQKRLPSQLNALGIRGGASESSAIRLGTNYGTNVASNESARNSAAESIRNAYAQQIADYNKNLNERLAQARATAEQNQIAFEREQMDKDLERFSGAIEGLYKSKDGYKELIAQLEASNDPNKEYKIMLARRAMNMLSSGGSGGGGGSRRSYGGGYGGSGGDDDTTTTKSSVSAKAGVSGGKALLGAISKGVNSRSAYETRFKNKSGGSSGSSSSGSGNKKGGGSGNKKGGRSRRSISRGNGLWY